MVYAYWNLAAGQAVAEGNAAGYLNSVLASSHASCIPVPRLRIKLAAATYGAVLYNSRVCTAAVGERQITGSRNRWNKENGERFASAKREASDLLTLLSGIKGLSARETELREIERTSEREREKRGKRGSKEREERGNEEEKGTTG